MIRRRMFASGLAAALAAPSISRGAAAAPLKFIPQSDLTILDPIINTVELMRGCGFSAAKLAAIQDICAKALDGTVPTRRQAARLSDDALIERLTAIRGVGRWTVEMLLIFTLGRPDVLPVDDFGVREGYRVLFGLDVQPKPRALAELGLPWAPHRSMATWYLYRAVEEARRQAPVSRA